MSHKTSMHEGGEDTFCFGIRPERWLCPGESYSGIVPTKQPNKSGQPPAEVVEGRPLTKENTPEPNSHQTPCWESGRSGLERVREAAKKKRKLKFTALLHHVSIDLLRESYYSLKRKAAPGVDGMTWQEYGKDLEVRLSDLHGRIHRGAYRARPSRRTWIQKSDGRKRPLGIATLEDKVVQYAVGKGSFFDKLQHDWLVQFVEHRIADKRVVRLIQKWLKAGVVEDGRWFQAEEGSPQGSGSRRF